MIKKGFFLTSVATLALVFSISFISPVFAERIMSNPAGDAIKYMMEQTIENSHTPTNPCSAGVGIEVDCSRIPQDHSTEKTNVKNLVADVVNWLLIATGILAVAMIIISGLQISASSGDAEKVGKAKHRLLWSVVGLALALLASVIVNLTISVVNNVQKTDGAISQYQVRIET